MNNLESTKSPDNQNLKLPCRIPSVVLSLTAAIGSLIVLSTESTAQDSHGSNHQHVHLQPGYYGPNSEQYAGQNFTYTNNRFFTGARYQFEFNCINQRSENSSTQNDCGPNGHFEASHGHCHCNRGFSEINGRCLSPQEVAALDNIQICYSPHIHLDLQAVSNTHTFRFQNGQQETIPTFEIDLHAGLDLPIFDLKYFGLDGFSLTLGPDIGLHTNFDNSFGFHLGVGTEAVIKGYAHLMFHWSPSESAGQISFPFGAFLTFKNTNIHASNRNFIAPESNQTFFGGGYAIEINPQFAITPSISISNQRFVQLGLIFGNPYYHEH
jgi:hypothetical protein